jgi:hypothetical protein
MTRLYICCAVTTPAVSRGLEPNISIKTYSSARPVVSLVRSVVVQNVLEFAIKAMIANLRELLQQLIVIVGKNVNVKH